MNRSIFPIWYDFNFFLKNVVFVLLLYLFNFFNSNFLVCEDLVKAVINGVNVSHSPSISPLRLHNSVNFFKDYILKTPGTEYKLNIFKYLQLNGRRFNNRCVFDHYHLNLYLDNIYKVHYGFSLTHSPVNSLEFGQFSKYDLNSFKKTQYISRSLRIYDMDFLKIQIDSEEDVEKFKDYVSINKKKCFSPFENILKKK
jgi:hypothetical protein